MAYKRKNRRLTEALTTLSNAETDAAAKLAAMNKALGETDAEGEVTPATFETAEAAQDALDAALKVATDALEKSEGQVVRDVKDATLKAGLQQGLGNNATLTQENLETAQAAVQDLIDENETIFSATGSDAVFNLYNEKAVDEFVDFSSIKAADLGDITITLANFDATANNKDANGGGGRDTIIFSDLTGLTSEITIENMIIGDDKAKGFDTLVADGLDSFNTVAVTESNGYLTFTLSNGTGTGGSVKFTNLIQAKTLFNTLKAQGALPEELDFNSASAFATAFGSIMNTSTNDKGGASFVDLLEGYGNLVSEADLKGLEQASFTLEELQANALEAAGALEDARDVNSDAELLEGIVAGINAYMGAGGENIALDSNHTLLSLRGHITDALTGNADITLKEFLALPGNTPLGEDDIAALADGHVSDLILRVVAIENTKAGDEKANVEVVNGVAVFTGTTKPTTGEGTWAKGTTEGTFVYTPSAAENALVAKFDVLGERAGLVIEDGVATDALDAAGGTGANSLVNQLDAIDTQLEKLAGLQEAADDAQATLDEAQPSIDALDAAEKALVDAQDWFADSDYVLPELLDGALTATDGNDIFLFDAKAETAQVTDFGDVGEDSIFFGKGFTLVEITETGITGSQGDVNALEIFWQQVEGNVELYVEAVASAGNGTTEADLTKVTLVGVNGSEFQDNLDNGLLSLGDFIA